MTDDEHADETGDAVDEWDELDGDVGTPDTDPRHLDPAGDSVDVQRRHARAAIVDTALDDWEPSTGVEPAVARAQTRRAVEWLQEDGGRRTRVDFIAALADYSTLDTAEWWSRAVDPGLRMFSAFQLVEYTVATGEYRWIGE